MAGVVFLCDFYFQFDEVDISFYSGLLSVKRDGKWGFIDKTGKQVIGYRFDEDYGPSFYSPNKAFVYVDGHYEYINAKGRVIKL